MSTIEIPLHEGEFATLIGKGHTVLASFGTGGAALIHDPEDEKSHEVLADLADLRGVEPEQVLA